MEPSPTPTHVRQRVLGMLGLLAFILYLDRICISQAAPEIERELGISHTLMGLVFGAFTVAYGLFEVPTGHWGDRYGSRGVLTRIVVWWSVFTMLTGAAPGLIVLIVVRFLFGAGEAGAFPNAARVVARWFPVEARGRAQGMVITAALVGGAAAPVITAQLIGNLGWRWAFAALGLPGIVWAVVFYWWYRDNPAEHAAVNDAELRFIMGAGPAPRRAEHVHDAGVPDISLPEPHVIPWRRVLSSANIWLLGGIITCGSFTTYMFFNWYPSYMQKARGVEAEESSWMASLVLAGGALGSLLGGFLCDVIVPRGPRRRLARSLIGVGSLTSAGLAMAASVFFEEPWQAATCAAFACFGIHFQLANWWGAVTDISGKHVGALFGLMNSMGIPGAAGSPIFLGWFVDLLETYGYEGRARWDPAFFIYAGVLLVGGMCWLFVNANKSAVEPVTSPSPSSP